MSEWRRTEGGVPQVGSQLVEALWAPCLGNIQAELVASWEAASESVQLLHCLLIYNMRWIELTLAVQRERSRDEGEPEVKGSGEAEESEGQAEEWVE